MKIITKEPRFDVASAISPGQRDFQEDTLITDFPQGLEFGFAVLADGMGGHAAGDLASKIIVTEVFSEVKFQSSKLDEFEAECAEILWESARSANDCIRAHVTEHPGDRGMGSTLIAPIFIKDKLFWISIGDSPLYLVRDSKLTQLNEDHSMAPQIDLMLRSGMISEEEARTHPDRNCLTSVLSGDKVAKVDCPEVPHQIEKNDIYVVSSDGLQFLSNEEIEEIVVEHQLENASVITARLLDAVLNLDDPDQDNLSFSVVKVNWTDAAEASNSEELPLPLQLGVVNG